MSILTNKQLSDMHDGWAISICIFVNIMGAMHLVSEKTRVELVSKVFKRL